MGGGCFSVIRGSGVARASRDRVALVLPCGSFPGGPAPPRLPGDGFQYRRLLTLAVQQLPPEYALAYAQQVSSGHDSAGIHLIQLGQVLETHRRCGRDVNLRQCRILQREYRGYPISGMDTRPGLAMTPAVGGRAAAAADTGPTFTRMELDLPGRRGPATDPRERLILRVNQTGPNVSVTLMLEKPSWNVTIGTPTAP